MKLRLTYLSLSCVLFLLQAGCGGGPTGSAGASNTLEASHSCISCHESKGTLSPGSKQPIVTEWKASTHNTSNPLNTSKFGAGCTDCHGSGFLHDNVIGQESCAGCHSVGAQAVNPIKNPEKDGKCNKCHDKSNPVGFNALSYSAPGIPPGSTTAYTHYSTGRHGSYVALRYINNCRKCHNPHDNIGNKKQRQDWAKSGHGSTTSLFVISAIDFKTRGSSLPASENFGNFCVRCHTSSGYVNFTTETPLFSNVKTLPDSDGVSKGNYPAAPVTYLDKSREPINCNVCHDDGNPASGSSYSGKLRSVPAFPIWYMYSSHPQGVANTIRSKMPVQFDPLGSSNICVVCHSGRETGDIIKIADRQGLFDYTGTSNATRPSGITPHDFAAGANLQGKSGFHFYTSTAKYTSNPTHKTASSTIGADKGACIGCHMKTAAPHLFRPVTWLNDTLYSTILTVESERTVCVKCHTGNALNPLRSANYMNSQRDNYRAAVAALGTMIPASRDWKVTLGTTLGTDIVPGSGPGPGYPSSDGDRIRAGAYTMGANFVYSLFFNDPGAYTHNPTYTKQLIYDAIDWLADGQMNYGTASSQVYNKIDAVTASLTWSKGTPTVIYGQNGTPINAGGLPFTKTQALRFICKDYDEVNNPTVCNRW